MKVFCTCTGDDNFNHLPGCAKFAMDAKMKRANDEVGAMEDIVHALSKLEDESKRRVLRWAWQRFGLT